MLTAHWDGEEVGLIHWYTTQDITSDTLVMVGMVGVGDEMTSWVMQDTAVNLLVSVGSKDHTNTLSDFRSRYTMPFPWR